MNERMLEIKAAMATFLTAMGTILGWKGIMGVVWIAVMLLDYISGTFAACKDSKWSSKAARQGLWHKAGMILVVLVAGITDSVFLVISEHLPFDFTWRGWLLPLVLAWYIITEAGSILENSVKMGAKVPSWLVKVLKISLKTIDKTGEDKTGDGGDEHATD